MLRRQAAVALSMSILATMSLAAISPAASEPSERDINDAVRLRAEFGLRSGRAFVRDTFSDDAYTADDWGVPLSRDESQSLYDRVRRVGTVLPAVDIAAKRDGFAGVYYDQLRDGVPVFLFSKNRDAAREVLEAAIGGATSIEVKKVDRSLERLTAIKRSVVDAWSDLEAAGVNVVSVGYDIVGNRVEVGVAGSLDPAREALADFGSSVHVVADNVGEFDDCSGVSHCHPAKGGIRISGNAGSCTSGFMGRRTDGSNNYVVMLTAGHCLQFAQSGGNETWTHSGQVAGTSDGRVWANGTTLPSDVGIIKVDPDFRPTNKNKILTANADPTVQSIGFWFSTLYHHGVGLPVCRMGSKSPRPSGYPYKKCGSIEKWAVERKSCKGPGFDPPCSNIENVMVVSFDSIAGDSGGPYWLNNQYTPLTAIGLHVHSQEDSLTDPVGWYTPINEAVKALKDRKDITVHVCLDADC